MDSVKHQELFGLTILGMWSWLSKLGDFIDEALGGDFVQTDVVLPSMPQTPPTPSTTPNPAPQSLFNDFCGYIMKREDAVPANNNPFNCKYYYGGYLPIYGDVKCSVGGFAMFPTLALGILYGQNTVKEIIRNHPTLTFYTFFAGIPGQFDGFSPANDGNDPLSYGTDAANACGLPVNSPIAQILA